jgi:hypothetical protein
LIPDLPEPDRFAISAAMAVGALYDVGRIGKIYNFMAAMQSDYVKAFLKDLHVEVKFEGCGSFCLAWLERSR